MTIKKSTLDNITEEFGCWTWRDEDLNELVNPQLGIITGFEQLQAQLDLIRQIDLKELPPAGQVN